MRTRLAAGAVGAAVLLTLFGGNVAGADGREHVAQATDTPGQRHDSSPWMHNSPGRMTDQPSRMSERREGRYSRPGFRDNPLRLTTCALGTVLGRLTGRGNDCAANRYGFRT
ncbi:hypothetical protein OG754_20510 [Streptomyces decoyicus]|uniref:hypothetical protein n=1 Tax=Streptomyces decoyicus TaxID=249567 RepID=UPI002E2FD943|nr:hypothetical protein [Streptomyces decoyicus]